VFSSYRGPKIGVSHWLGLSPLQQFSTTVLTVIDLSISTIFNDLDWPLNTPICKCWGRTLYLQNPYSYTGATCYIGSSAFEIFYGRYIYIFILWFLMVALCNRADHYIFILWFLLSFFLSFFLSSFFPRLLWSPCGIGQTIIFSSCGFFFLSVFLLFFLA